MLANGMVIEYMFKNFFVNFANIFPINILYYLALLVIKTHGNESRGQEEAGRMRRMSELFTRSTAVKFVDALNKPPLELSLSYLGLSTF